MLQEIRDYFSASFARKLRRKTYRQAFHNKFKIQSFYSSDYGLPTNIDLITVSFNVPILVDYQIKLFKKFLSGNYRHIVCDNSTDYEAANLIKDLCEKNNITYIRVEDRTIPNGYSNSHAIALNWIWKNVIKKRKNNFALLDHDIYPVKNIDIEDYLKESSIYGKYESNKTGIWYLWPGFSFFNWNAVGNLPLNFHRYKKWGIFSMHGKNYVDTGSANWNCLYSKIDKNNLKPFSMEFVNCETGEPAEEGSADFVAYFNNRSWLHIQDGANRENKYQNRIEKICKILDNTLTEERECV